MILLVFLLVIVLSIITLVNLCVKVWLLTQSGKYDESYTPASQQTGYKIAIHVPISNEDPEVVLRTLEALRNLNYEDFQVWVIDNNTRSDDLWMPVEKYCHDFPEVFNFYHVEYLEGFKAGALQFALERTPEEFEFLSFVDSDNLVKPGYLTDLAGLFDDPNLAIIQTPLGFEHDPADSRF